MKKKKIGKNYCAWDEKIGSDYKQWVCTRRPEISSLRNGYFCHTGFGFCYGEAKQRTWSLTFCFLFHLL